VIGLNTADGTIHFQPAGPIRDNQAQQRSVQQFLLGPRVERAIDMASDYHLLTWVTPRMYVHDLYREPTQPKLISNNRTPFETV